jgi:hypothetical protein
MTKSGTLAVAVALTCVLLMLYAWGQSGEAGTARVQSASDLKKEPKPATAVAASDPVLTIQGLCEDHPVQPPAAAEPCTAVVTREAFERLLDSMNITGRTITPEIRRNLAETYAQYLGLERLATKAGLEKTPQFAEIMRWWRLRTLADLYRGNLQEQFRSPSHDEVHAYYVEHLASYQRIKASRILIPRTMGTTEEAQRADKEALETANLARERAAKGEDPDLIQKDAYTALGLSSPPITNLGTLARSSFPTEETDELYSLESGQVSKVETEGASYVIYRITSKETLSEDALKDEISRQIAQDKFNQAIQSAKESAKPEFNRSYFGSSDAASAYANPWKSPHPQ